jgi:hypothetical protein
MFFSASDFSTWIASNTGASVGFALSTPVATPTNGSVSTSVTISGTFASDTNGRCPVQSIAVSCIVVFVP